MIEQQYYTRERGGLFSQTDGYDTIAKSPLLKLDYIKKYIHPFCHYDIPSKLQKDGEMDESKYPPNFMVVPLGDGQMLIGEGIYKSKDFTGQRSTFFMHNFILSENEKRRYIKEPEKIFGINSFAKGYDEGVGRELPTLAAIPYEAGQALFKDRALLFEKISMTQEMFNKLIYASFIAGASKKKIFIVLGVPMEELGTYAKALLYHLYVALPWHIAERLGVCTYANKLEPRKNIQITFIDQETLQNEGKKSKEFIFDLPNQKVLNIEERMESTLYLQLAPTYCVNKAVWEKYNNFAEELGKVLSGGAERSIVFYGKVILFFEMSLYLKSNKIYDIPNEEARNGLLPQLVVLYKKDLLEETKRLILELIEYTVILLHEAIKQGQLLSKEEIIALAQFKLQICQGSKEQANHLGQVVLLNLHEAIKQHQISYVDEVVELFRNYPEFYYDLYKIIYDDEVLRKEIIYHQMDREFTETMTVEELQIAIDQKYMVEEILLSDEYCRSHVIKSFETAILKVEEKLQLLQGMQTWASRHKGMLYTTLVELVEEHFLSTVNFSKDIPSEKMLCQLSFSKQYTQENYEIIEAYQMLKSDISIMSPERIRINAKVQELIKLFYKGKAQKNDFYLLVYAFLEPGKELGTPQLNLKKILNYLKQINMELMFKFIIWSKGQEAYIDKTKFDRQIINYFLGLRDKKQKVSNKVIRQELGTHAKTKILAEKIIKAQQPTLMRVLTKSKGMGLILLLVIIGGGIGMSSYYIYSYKHQSKETLSPTNLVSEPSDEKLKEPMQYVFPKTESIQDYIEENKPDGIKDTPKNIFEKVN